MSLYDEVKERLDRLKAEIDSHEVEPDKRHKVESDSEAILLVKAEQKKFNEKRPKYKNADSFKIMEYYCKTCEMHEMIWNSRDAVSPFGTSCSTKDCKGHMIHINWHKDVVNSLYKPPPGTRYFADITRAKAETIATEMIDSANDFNTRHGHGEVLEKGTDEYIERFYELVTQYTHGDCSMDILTAE